MTQIVIRFHHRFYRPWIAPVGFWVCMGLLFLVNALDGL